MDKTWKLKPCPVPAEQQLYKLLHNHVPLLLCRLLTQRGISRYEEAQQFFFPSLEHLHDPWLMKDMDKAVNRIVDAISHGEKILVYGDYDVDGTTAVATVYSFLLEQYNKIDFYVPNRDKEGYGISMQGIEYAKNNDFDLVIALDCGIRATNLISIAKEQGIEFIVCDHHLPGEELPPAVAILNPKQEGCHYPYKDLSACGIGFKLVSALALRRGTPAAEVLPYLTLVATSIAADIVPMNGENRVMTHFGLKYINENPQPGIKALIELSQVKTSLTTSNLVFMIAPRVNAAGRMGDARKAVQLFLEKDAGKAKNLAQSLHEENGDRKIVDLHITTEAINLIKDDEENGSKKATVLYQPHWHKGVVGIVASRLIDKHYYKPTVILTQSNDVVAGSARSVIGFNVYDAIHQCRDLLENYGGHFYAAGMTMKVENVEAFKSRFEEVVASTITEEMLTPQIIIDTEIQLQDITPHFYKKLKMFEPFGPENMRPLFVARNVKDAGYSKIVKDEHLKLTVKQDQGPIFGGIGFYMKDKFPLISGGKLFDIAFTIEENDWNGNVSLQLKVVDIQAAQ